MRIHEGLYSKEIEEQKKKEQDQDRIEEEKKDENIGMVKSDDSMLSESGEMTQIQSLP